MRAHSLYRLTSNDFCGAPHVQKQNARCDRFPAKCTIQYRMRVPIPVCLRPCVRQNKFRPQVREQFPGPRFAPVQRAMAKYSAAMVEHESAERLQKVPALAAIRE